jgi:hypothetical protein
MVDLIHPFHVMESLNILPKEEQRQKFERIRSSLSYHFDAIDKIVCVNLKTLKLYVMFV